MSLRGRGGTIFLRHGNSGVQGGFIIPEVMVICPSQESRERECAKNPGGDQGAGALGGKVCGMMIQGGSVLVIQGGKVVPRWFRRKGGAMVTQGSKVAP